MKEGGKEGSGEKEKSDEKEYELSSEKLEIFSFLALAQNTTIGSEGNTHLASWQLGSGTSTATPQSLAWHSQLEHIKTQTLP